MANTTTPKTKRIHRASFHADLTDLDSRYLDLAPELAWLNAAAEYDPASFESMLDTD